MATFMTNEVEQLRLQRELKEMHALLASLRDEDWQVRLKAASSLGKLRKTDEMLTEVVPALMAAASDRNDYVSRAAVASIGDIGAQAKTAVNLLIEKLGHEEESMRRGAAYSLGKIGASAVSAVPTLIELLEEESREIQKAVSWALGIIGPEAVPLLSEGLQRNNPNVRAGCAYALGSIGPNAITALAELRERLQDEHAQVRYNAAKAVGNLRAAKETEAAVPQLISCLKDKDPDVRWAVAEALRKIGTDEAMEAWLHFESKPEVNDLVKQLSNTDKAVRMDAAAGLVKIIAPDDGKYVPEIAKALTDQFWRVKVPICETLAKIGPNAREAIPGLKRALNDENERVRAAAAHALGRIGKSAEDAVERLVKKLKDEFKEVRLAAAVALELIDTAEAKRALKKFTWE